ncbi:Uncharacterized protein dnm_010660 [Desulfonema magnum]|uniref:Uncharacterized protein n=1 Tax=Desulfonema magnum TaxID=45655 RepID=A0A975GKV3_9BACT|nr:Uncharacterized protein dnm_010660 [Desulfonema magnum]
MKKLGFFIIQEMIISGVRKIIFSLRMLFFAKNNFRTPDAVFCEK